MADLFYYKFLEENDRLVDVAQRAQLQLGEQQQKAQVATGAYENLRKFVYRLFGIELKLMPTASTRHQHNKTRFNKACFLCFSLFLLFSLFFLAGTKKRE